MVPFAAGVVSVRRTTILLAATALLSYVGAVAQTGLLSYSDKYEIRPTDRSWCGTTARLTLTSPTTATLDRSDANLQHFVSSIGKALADECPQAAVAIVTARTEQSTAWTETISAAKEWKLTVRK